MNDNVSNLDAFVKCLYPPSVDCNGVGVMSQSCPRDEKAVESCAAIHGIPACVSDGFKEDIECLQKTGNIINSTASYNKVLELKCPNIIDPLKSDCKYDLFVKCLYRYPYCGKPNPPNSCPVSREDIDTCAKEYQIGECVAGVFRKNFGCLQNYTTGITRETASYETIARKAGCTGISGRSKSEYECRTRQCNQLQPKVHGLPNCLDYSYGNKTGTVCCQDGKKVAPDQTGLWKLGTGNDDRCFAGTAVINGDSWCVSKYRGAFDSEFSCRATPKICNASSDQCSGYPGICN